MYTCPYCVSTTLFKSDMKKHIQNCNKNLFKNSTDNLCIYCGITFFSLESVNSHLNSCARNIYKVKCSLCNFYYENETALSFHLKDCSEDSLKTFGLSSKSILGKIKKKKSGICKHCGKEKLNVDVHEIKCFSKKINNRRNPVKTKILNVDFKNDLSINENITSREKEYSCPLCRKKVESKEISNHLVSCVNKQWENSFKYLVPKSSFIDPKFSKDIIKIDCVPPSDISEFNPEIEEDGLIKIDEESLNNLDYFFS